AARPDRQRIPRTGRGRAAPALARRPDRGPGLAGVPARRREGNPMTLDELRAALAGTPKDAVWFEAALAQAATEPGAIAAVFPAVSRLCGRAGLPQLPGWTVDDAARVLLLAALPRAGDPLAEEVRQLYRYGDAAEKRAVLRALPLLEVGDRCVDLLHDALRTNDPRLV